MAEIPTGAKAMRNAIRNGRTLAGNKLAEKNLEILSVRVHGKTYAYYTQEVGT